MSNIAFIHKDQIQHANDVISQWDRFSPGHLSEKDKVKQNTQKYISISCCYVH